METFSFLCYTSLAIFFFCRRLIINVFIIQQHMLPHRTSVGQCRALKRSHTISHSLIAAYNHTATSSKKLSFIQCITSGPGPYRGAAIIILNLNKNCLKLKVLQASCKTLHIGLLQGRSFDVFWCRNFII